MRKFINAFLSLCIVISAFSFLATGNSVSAQTGTVEVGGNTLTFSLSSKTVTITGYTGSLGATLTIPGTVDGYYVTAIGASAFKNCTGITAVKFTLTASESVKEEVDDGYFPGYWSLRSTVTSYVETIGASAFNGCTKLTSIEIPLSVTLIGKAAFGNSGVKTINYSGNINEWNSVSKTASDFTGLKIVYGELLSQDKATPPELFDRTPNSITLVAQDGYEYRKKGDTSYQTSNVFTGLEPNTQYRFARRLAAKEGYSAGEESDGVTFTTDKLTQGKAVAPSVLSKTHIAVTLVPVTGCEYSLDGEVWQTSNVFTSLESSTDYTFYQRYAETDKSYAGEVSDSIVVKTYSAQSELVYSEEDGCYYHYCAGERQYDTSLIENTDGKIYYIKEGIRQYDSGLVLIGDYSYHLQDGIKLDTTGFVEDYYVIDGVCQTDTGFVQIGEDCYYLVNGKNEKTTGLVKHTDGKWYYVSNGICQSTTGLVKHTNGKWYYTVNGIWQRGYKGLAKHTNGKWYYTVNGIWQRGYKGLVRHTNSKWYYTVNGIWQRGYKGLVRYTNGKWYYTVNGIWQSGYNGLAKHTNGKWYYTVRGIWQNGYNGLARHTNGKWYYTVNGIWKNGYKGLVKHTNGKWYYTVNGIWQTTTGFVKHTNAKYYYVKNGIWQSSYKGLVKFNNKRYYTVKGIRQYTTGTVKINGKSYTLVNGVLK